MPIQLRFIFSHLALNIFLAYFDSIFIRHDERRNVERSFRSLFIKSEYFLSL